MKVIKSSNYKDNPHDLLPPGHFVKRMQEGEFVFGGEIEYSTSLDLSTYQQQAEYLKSHTSVISIPDNPGSNIYLSNIAIAQAIRPHFPHDIVLSIACRDCNRLGLGTRIITAYALGLRNLLLVTGDHPSLGSVPSSKPVFDLDSTQFLQICQEFNHSKTLFGIKFEGPEKVDSAVIPKKLVLGAVTNVNNFLTDIEVARIYRKIALGVDFLQTQVIFEIERVIPLLKEFHTLKIPVMAGIVPVKDYKLAKQIAAFLPGVKFPKWLLQEYKKAWKSSENGENREKLFNKINVDYYSPIIRELKKKNLIQGLYFATIDYPSIIPALKQSILNN